MVNISQLKKTGSDMKVMKIVGAWLEANGYDGIFSEWCACKLDNLFPCGEIYNCEAGHFTECPGFIGNCAPCNCEGYAEFHIGEMPVKE